MTLELDIDHFSKLRDDGFRFDHCNIWRYQSEYFHRDLHNDCTIYFGHGEQLCYIHHHWKILSNHSQLQNTDD